MLTFWLFINDLRQKIGRGLMQQDSGGIHQKILADICIT